MSPVRAILDGTGAVRRAWRVWVLLWVVTVGFAAVLILPAAAIFQANLGHSLYAARLLDNFDPQWGAEFLFQTGKWPLAAVPPLIAALAVAYLLLVTFLNGGVLAIFTGAESFWTGCGRNFWRLLRLLFLSFGCYALVLAANIGLAKVGRALWGEGMEEHPLVIYGWVRAAAVVIALLLINMVFDYAKIRAVAENSGSPFRTALGSFAFVATNFGRTAGTYVLICAMVLAAAAAYWSLSSVLPRSEVAWLAIVFTIQQAFVALRVALRLLFLSSQTEVFLSLRQRESEPADALDTNVEPGR